MFLDFIINSVLPAILPTIIVKEFIINPIIENKLIHNWCNKTDMIKTYLDSGVSKNHPTVKRLIKEEEEAYRKMVEFAPYLNKKNPLR